jgi:hypothetical protein
MTDEKKNVEDKAVESKPVKPKKKTSKAKPKVSGDVQTEAKSASTKKADVLNTAPYLTQKSPTPSAHSSPSQGKFLTSLLLIIVVAGLVATTIYRFNEERNSDTVAAQAVTGSTDTIDTATQSAVDVEDTPPSIEPASIEPVSAVATPADVETSQTDSATAETESSDVVAAIDTQRPAAVETPTDQPASAAQSSDNTASIKQRQQALEEEMRAVQKQYKELLQGRDKLRAEFIEKQKAEFERLRQKQLEIRMKAFEISRQMRDLHIELGKLSREAKVQKTP